MHSKKSKIILISTLILGAAAAAVLFYWTGNSGNPADIINSQIQEQKKPVLKTYINTGYGFSFDYPSEWEVSYFSDETGKTILAQKADDPQQDVQVYIQPFDEPETSLTKQRILKDLPGMTIENEKAMTLASGINALSFSGRDENFGKTREVWFVHNGFLYQITAPSGNQEILEKMINSWKLNNSQNRTEAPVSEGAKAPVKPLKR